MVTILNNHLSTGLFLLSLICLVELIIKFKRPLILKWLLILICSSIGFAAIGEFYCSQNGYNRWLIEFPRTIYTLSYLTMLVYVFNPKMLRFIAIPSVLVLLIQIGSNVYFDQMASFNLPLRDIPNQIGNTIKWYYHIVRFLMLLSAAYLAWEIKKKYYQQNVYFDKLKIWILVSAVHFYIGIAANMADVYFKGINIYVHSFISFNRMAFVLIILFRPYYLNRTKINLSLSSLFTQSNDALLTLQPFEIAFFDNLYYLKKEASSEQLSQQLEVSAEELNNFVFKQYGLAFIDLVNKHRVQYFRNAILSGKSTNLTIESMAFDAGFNSRQSLYRAFKKFHGGSPSDLMRSVNN